MAMMDGNLFYTYPTSIIVLALVVLATDRHHSSPKQMPLPFQTTPNQPDAQWFVPYGENKLNHSSQVTISLRRRICARRKGANGD